MDTQSSHTNPARELPSRLNWLRFMEAEGPFVICEYPLYSDAHLTGECREGLGPYSFINTVPAGLGSGVVNAAMVLRMSIYQNNQLPDMSKTDVSRYHGGTLVDEVAALASMALGARVWAGGLSREFRPGGDPYGQPWEWDRRSKPVLHVGGANHLSVLPSIAGARSTRSLNILEVLRSVPGIVAARYVNLVRACRSYQNALWMAESEPAIAWLMLVSALEVAASDVYRKPGHEKRLRDSHPRLVKYLENHCGGDQHIAAIAKLLAPMVGATRKFVDFSMQFMPKTPPSERPTREGLQFKWSKENLHKALRKIYNYRSRYLHGGLPFPDPMLEPRYLHVEDSPIPPEVPIVGLATYSKGGVWVADDLPMTLDFFHYIARGILLNWWRQLELAGSQADGCAEVTASQ